MAPSDAVDFTSQPFTFTNSVDSASFQSMMSTISENANNGESVTLSPQQSSLVASFSSLIASVTAASSPANQGTNTGVASTLVTSTTAPQNVASSQSSGLLASSESSLITSTNSAAASSTGSQSGSIASSNTGSSAISTASSAASNSSTNLQKESSGGLNSPGLRAAVAVPVVVVGLVIIALIAVCVRRRKRRAQDEDPMEKMPAMADRRKKWSRHLRIFSFDTELLMGGRFSSTNSIRSRRTGSVRSQTRSQHTPAPSEHSTESEVAPPYRDALAAGAAGGAIAGARTAHAPSPLGRSMSNATAPPPYISAGTAGSNAEAVRPTSARSNQNPFADTTSPVSPVDGSPFNDPETPTLSRNSSLYRNRHQDEASSIGGASDAASIREATLARNASVMSGGRIIENVNRRSS